MPKLLAHFLLEHQEPFALDVYLVERGYSKQRLRNRARFFKKRDVVPNCTAFARALFGRLILHNDNGKIKNETIEDDADTKLSPDSVLQETESNEGSATLHEDNFNSTTQGESSLAHPIYQCKPKQPTHNFHNPYNQYIINKRALRQSKQLLIDCVRELIDKHRQREDKILGTDELWKHVCENVWVWSQNSIHENNIIHLLNYDFMASEVEFGSYTMLHKEEISKEIGDAIFESIICETFC
ncbi:hypothetical protein CASFOL_038189 [Castilleja foliolosa]|uniref:DUF4378 domain-containing protein n=1 Tax=Castilleja foliolosa TaxID=1961234 RepID=A0ABD3BKX3_9LAMI